MMSYAPGLSGYEMATTDIKPFTAGSDVTIFEFLEKFSAYCAGTKKIKAYKLYNNYLSTSIQAQTASFQQDYDVLIKFLKTTYGKIKVISGGLLTELEKRKKPAYSDFQEQAESLLAIANVILRIRNLKTKLPEEQVTAEITSYNFLHRIRNLLSTTDYMDLSKDLIENDLDALVAAGEKALELTLSRIKKTVALLEPMVVKLKARPKVKSVHTIGTLEESSHVEVRTKHQDRSMDQVCRIDNRLVKSGKWWNANFKYPCPVDSHNHELY